jgi:hypothetical protein
MSSYNSGAALKASVVCAVLILICSILLGCASTGSVDRYADAPLKTICEINEGHGAADEVVKIKANFHLVKDYASFFSEGSCKGNETLAEGNRAQADKSVKKFLAEGERLCNDSSTASLCTLEAEVVATVKLRVGSSGRFVADQIHINQYKYLPLESEAKSKK